MPSSLSTSSSCFTRNHQDESKQVSNTMDNSEDYFHSPITSPTMIMTKMNINNQHHHQQQRSHDEVSTISDQGFSMDAVYENISDINDNDDRNDDPGHDLYQRLALVDIKMDHGRATSSDSIVSNEVNYKRGRILNGASLASSTVKIRALNSDLNSGDGDDDNDNKGGDDDDDDGHSWSLDMKLHTA